MTESGTKVTRLESKRLSSSIRLHLFSYVTRRFYFSTLLIGRTAQTTQPKILRTSSQQRTNTICDLPALWLCTQVPSARNSFHFTTNRPNRRLRFLISTAMLSSIASFLPSLHLNSSSSASNLNPTTPPAFNPTDNPDEEEAYQQPVEEDASAKKNLTKTKNASEVCFIVISSSDILLNPLFSRLLSLYGLHPRNLTTPSTSKSNSSHPQRVTSANPLTMPTHPFRLRVPRQTAQIRPATDQPPRFHPLHRPPQGDAQSSHFTIYRHTMS